MLDGLDETVARAFQRSLATLSAAGARIEEIELAPLAEVAAINATGGFAAAESWAFHRRWLADREAEYDPRVARRIRRGEAMSAADYIDLLAARRAWIARMEGALRGFDALLSPTVPMVAPPLAPLVADDDAFFAANGLLLRNPSIVNLLDGCALSLPCHVDDELPVGLMVWSAAPARRRRPRRRPRDRSRARTRRRRRAGARAEDARRRHRGRRDRRDDGLRARRRRPRGDGVRAPRHRRRRMQLRQRRPGRARLRRALGRAGHAGQGRAPSLRRARAGADRRPPRCRDARLALALVARLPAAGLPREPRAHAPPRPLQPRAPARS